MTTALLTRPYASVLALACLSILMLGGCDRRPVTDQSGAPSSDASKSSGDSASAPMAKAPETAPTPAAATPAPVASAGAVIDDSIITTKIKTALLTDPVVKGSEVSVETDKGVVVLSGTAATADQIEQAKKIAGAVDGVKSVDNKIALKK
ncbi:hyperosmotically inducible protein [Actimicrobium sp. GrIS 1.19]|uniref:BON domain-containing protein n=1 Tax=Actimicrobium sp. GrIS 1.19 TaxID=3071708 RepID=UPI002DFA701A|nr:hyperosmotically inducible protein [Actimicrobium sp. GrIS 1.19]